MSNMAHLNGLTYFSIPELLINSGTFVNMSGAETKLYCLIWYLSQRKSKVSLFISSNEATEQAGISARNLLIARAGLEDKGLVTFLRQSGGYTYTLLHPGTTKPLMNSTKGEYEPLDFTKLDASQLRKYYGHHLTRDIEETAKGLRSVCPFHDDSSPSLEITIEGTKGSVWHCHGCKKGGKLIDFETAIAVSKGSAIDATEAHSRIRRILVSTGAIDGTLGLPEAEYAYRDEHGNLLFECLRYRNKKFKTRRVDPDKPGYYIWNLTGVKRVLYNLQEVIDAETVIVVEGEKDADNLRSVYLIDDNGERIAVTTCPMGAEKWQSSYSVALKGKRVVIIPDSDVAGNKHGQMIKKALDGFATDVRLCRLPEGFKDITDYLGEHGRSEVIDLIGEDWISRPVEI